MENIIGLTFQSGDFFNNSSSLFETIVGSLIGGLVSIGIFYLGIRYEKNKKIDEKKEQNFDTLKYYASLLKNIISFAEEQSKSYKLHSKNIRTAPLQNHLPSQLVIYSVESSYYKLSFDKLFHAFVSNFGNNTDTIKEFEKINSRVDFLFQIYNEGKRIQENYLLNLHDRLIKYKSLVEEETKAYCNIICNNISNNHQRYFENEFYISLHTCIENYHNAVESIDKSIPDSQNKSFYLLQNEFIEPLKSELINKHRDKQEAIYLLENCRKATWLFNETINHVQNTARIFEDYSNELKTKSESLAELSKKILATLEN